MKISSLRQVGVALIIILCVGLVVFFGMKYFKQQKIMNATTLDPKDQQSFVEHVSQQKVTEPTGNQIKNFVKAVDSENTSVTAEQQASFIESLSQ